ncbi:monooxygenase [Salmonirosea aquatica]|uniref:Copper type II ascorbate-dependent monooxygenase C-terminal domain-containing protein n=1 Tax=Salmonirosea aquatica TaxID=2654236 RepID=A0A7C9F7F0_9BACT|nr:hypothetical protein [Cytophagaceae bacterium SJW1-29]
MQWSRYIVAIIWVAGVRGYAQRPVTYQTDVAPILQSNCIECHRKGGIGPFPLTTYEEVAKRAKFIGKVTQSRYMPPFRADRNFQQYANERGLSEEEISTIQAWVTHGSPEGKRSRNKSVSIENDTVQGTSAADFLEWSMTKPYEIIGNEREDFRYFNIPTNLEKDVYVKAIEFKVGNRKVLHHSRLMTDTTRTMRGIDGMREDDPRVIEFQKTPLEEDFLYGWVPGNDRVNFPPGTAKRIRAGTDLLLNMHYAPSPIDETDQSGVRFYLTDSAQVEREVRTLTLTENDITNQPFVLPAESKPTFYMSYGPTQQAISLISVMPHMHFLGKKFRAFAITPGGELVPFVKIEDWDYAWQMTYQFKTLLHLPAGSTIIAEATYDNTSQNPENPSQPAREVTYGWNSTNEMMNLVLYYIPYKEGDETRSQER